MQQIGLENYKTCEGAVKVLKNVEPVETFIYKYVT